METDEKFGDVTSQVASFVHDIELSDVPASARHAARRAFVNILGCCIGGAEHEIVEIAAKALMPFAGAATTTVLGRPDRTDMLTAVLLNGLSSAAYSFDDTHAEAIVHPSGAVASALLALAEQQRMTGEQFLVAFAAGIDVACRTSKAVSVAPAEGDVGWSQTGIAAGVGAAVAAAKVLGLDQGAIAWAIGIAASQASGFRAAHGTMCATLIFGHAAQTGLRGALLARQGFTASIATLEGKYGFASLFATRPHVAYLTDSLGKRFEVEALAYKPYPCGVVIHPALDAALEWYRSTGGASGSIARVLLRAHPDAMALGFRRHPAGVLEAKVSLCHWVAAALSYGRASLAEGQQGAIDDPSVSKLRSAIDIESDSTLGPDAAVMTVCLANGDRRTVVIEHCKGSIANPMSDEDISNKFMGQAATTLAAPVAASLLERSWDVEALQDVGDIARMARRAS